MFRRAESSVWMVAAVVCGSASACCFGGPAPSAPVAPTLPPTVTPTPTPTTLPTVAPASPPLSLAPGFAPQPMTQAGNAFGGTVNALNLSPACRGYVPTQPQHVLDVTAPIPALTVAINTRGTAGSVFDATLVIRAPDGTYLCDDDSEGRDPHVRGAFASGRYDVYVGAYSGSSIPADSEYVLGVSETDVLPSALPEPPDAPR